MAARMELPSGLRAFHVMPTIYEYFGIRVFFWGNEHSPIHVHGRYHDRESKAEIDTNQEDEITAIRWKDIAGRMPLEDDQLRDFKKLVKHEAKNIVKFWKEFFNENKHIEPRRITRRIR